MLLFSAPLAFSHGEIESIDCADSSKKISLKGKPLQAGNRFEISISRDGKALIQPKKLTLALKDIVKDKQVIEQITLNLGKDGTAILKVPEDYSKEVRPGKGTISLTNPKMMTDVACTVKY